jgi:integrase/recombinase XerD
LESGQPLITLWKKDVCHESVPGCEEFSGLPQDELERKHAQELRIPSDRLSTQFGDRERDSISSEDVLAFLSHHTDGAKQSTKRLLFSLLRSFFAFIINPGNEKFVNPCESPPLRKTFKDQKAVPWKIVEKETVDEIIFRTEDKRNRLIMEMMARGGMRIGEVLKLTPSDIQGGRVVIQTPESGRQVEVAFIPQKLANRLEEYIRQKGIKPSERIFPISYPAARIVVKKAGDQGPGKRSCHSATHRANVYRNRDRPIFRYWNGNRNRIEAI